MVRGKYVRRTSAYNEYTVLVRFNACPDARVYSGHGFILNNILTSTNRLQYSVAGVHQSYVTFKLS